MRYTMRQYGKKNFEPMSQLTYPFCYHPTTIVVVCTQKPMLHKLCEAIDKEKFIVKLFSDPVQALQYLNTMRFASFDNRCTHTLEEKVTLKKTMGFDFSKVHEELFESSRFSQLTCTVADYHLKGMHCFDFFNDILNRYINRIFITEKMDARLITDAFNRGLIEKYVHFNSDNFKSEINESLQELTLKYFMTFSKPIFNTILTRLSQCETVFTEPSYVSLLKDTMEKYLIKEYYLKDSKGSYLLLSKSGKWLSINIENTPTPGFEKMPECSNDYFYQLADFDIEQLPKNPVLLEQFYQKHPPESVY